MLCFRNSKGSLFVCLHHLGAALHRLDDIDVARTAAEITVEPVIDLVVRGIGIVLEHRTDCHDHARRAKPALQRMAISESLLHRMQLAILAHTLNGNYIGAVSLHSEQGAGLDRPAIEMHGAASALARVAADMRSGQTELISQEIRQQYAVFDFLRVFGAVYRKFDSSHGSGISLMLGGRNELLNRAFCHYLGQVGTVLARGVDIFVHIRKVDDKPIERFTAHLLCKCLFGLRPPEDT